MYLLKNLKSSVVKLLDRRISRNLQNWKESVVRRRKIKKKKRN